jgi:undecaprenyl diphosphate synthase
MNNGPKTVAIFMDGNRRWAKAHGLSQLEGHEAGKDILFKFVDFYTELREKWGTKHYVFYAFSTENWNRAAEEVAGIMGIFERALEEFDTLFPKLEKEGIRIRFVGQRERLSTRLQELMEHIEEKTAAHSAGSIVLAISYGGRADIIQAANHLIEEGKEIITEEDLSTHLWTAIVPDPDLIIRPGGEMRLSNFFTWPSAYSELAFTNTLWPDFSQEELERIFEDYASRERRRGK